MPRKKQKTVFYAVVEKETKHIKIMPFHNVKQSNILIICENKQGAQNFIKEFKRQEKNKTPINLIIKKIKTILL